MFKKNWGKKGKDGRYGQGTWSMCANIYPGAWSSFLFFRPSFSVGLPLFLKVPSERRFHPHTEQGGKRSGTHEKPVFALPGRQFFFSPFEEHHFFILAPFSCITNGGDRPMTNWSANPSEYTITCSLSHVRSVAALLHTLGHNVWDLFFVAGAIKVDGLKKQGFVEPTTT